MSYLNAPGTKLIATRCACCARPLLDSQSVEIGMGPTCRKKHGFDCSPHKSPNWNDVILTLDKAFRIDPELDFPYLLAKDERAIANLVVNRIAVRQKGLVVSYLVLTLEHLGFSRLSNIIAERIGVVRVSNSEEGKLVLTSFYDANFLNRVKEYNQNNKDKIYWHHKKKAFVVKKERAKELWNLVKNSFPIGTIVIGSKGIKIIENQLSD